MMKKQIGVVSVLFIACQVCSAEESAVSPWKGEAELGFISTSGNTESETLNGKAKITKEEDKWRHQGELSALNATEESGTTAERYNIKGQGDYKVSKQNYFFGLVSYEKDRFSGYDYQANESVGYGWRVLDTNDMKLDLEIGPGARQSRLDTGESENEFTVHGAAKYAWSITETSEFTEDLVTEPGENITITRSTTALSSKINGDLAMKLSYTIKHSSEVPVGFDKTDTETAVTLVYKY